MMRGFTERQNGSGDIAVVNRSQEQQAKAYRLKIHKTWCHWETTVEQGFGNGSSNRKRRLPFSLL